MCQGAERQQKHTETAVNVKHRFRDALKGSESTRKGKRESMTTTVLLPRYASIDGIRMISLESRIARRHSTMSSSQER